MPEALAAVGVLTALVMLAALNPSILLWVGAGLTVTTLLISLAAGLVYHVRLGAAIARKGPRPAHWWWAPTRFHAQLDERDKAWVLSWFRVGAMFFALCGLGCFVIAGAIAKAFLMSR